MIYHFARCIKLKIKLVFIHHFWRHLLTRIILLTGHTTGCLADFITVSSPDFGLNLGTVNTYRTFWVCFGAISSSFGLAMGILAQPNSPDMPPKCTEKVRLGIKITIQ